MKKMIHHSRGVRTVELASIGGATQEDSVKKISKAELKKAILKMEAERLKHPATFRPDRSQRATLQKSRRASEKKMFGFLKEAGLDLRKFQALQEQRSAEPDRMVAKHKKEALKRASQSKDTLYSSIAGQSIALRDLASERIFSHILRLAWIRPSSSGRSRSWISLIPQPCPSAVLRSSNFRHPSPGPRRWVSTSIGLIPFKIMR